MANVSRYAIVENGVVVNTASADDDLKATELWGNKWKAIPANTVVNIGYTVDGAGNFVAPAAPAAAPDPAVDALNTMFAELNAATTLPAVKTALTKGLGKAIRPDKF